MPTKNIFLIEDDYVYATFISKSLGKNSDYRVNHYSNAEDALQALGSNVPDALIVDFMLPKMSGIDFFEAIKNQVPKDLKIILFSATDDGNMVLNFIQKGIRDYVIKDESAVESLEAILSGKDEDYFLFN